ncbi:hypothetical protein DJ564_30580 [Pseudomonas sp. 31-12]|nr:hypothetical protein DJ564_30580 [Pseudomonas sp. 31-12]
MGGINQAERWIVTARVMVSRADAIASRLAPTLDLRRTQNPCGSEPARDGARMVAAVFNEE